MSEIVNDEWATTSDEIFSMKIWSHTFQEIFFLLILAMSTGDTIGQWGRRKFDCMVCRGWKIISPESIAYRKGVAELLR